MYRRFYNKTFFLNGPFSIFLNSSFWVRRGLFRSISENREYVRKDVLDLGCGSKPYRSLFDCDSYTGIDVETGAHSHRGESIDLIYDGKKIPLPESKFDTVFSSQVFEHIEDIELSLSEIHRVLRPKGILFATLPFVGAEHEIPYDFRRLTSFGVERLLKQHGFRIVKIEKIGNYPEVLAQTFIFYIAGYFPKNKIVKLLLTLLIIAPLNILSFVICSILPKRNDIFNDILCIGEKIG